MQPIESTKIIQNRPLVTMCAKREFTKKDKKTLSKIDNNMKNLSKKSLEEVEALRKYIKQNALLGNDKKRKYLNRISARRSRVINREKMNNYKAIIQKLQEEKNELKSQVKVLTEKVDNLTDYILDNLLHPPTPPTLPDNFRIDETHPNPVRFPSFVTQTSTDYYPSQPSTSSFPFGLNKS